MAFGDSTPEYRQWQVPPQLAPEDRRLGWLREANEDGLAWLSSQRGVADWQNALEVISGRDTRKRAAYKSKVAPNRLKRDIREIVGTMSKLRPIWGYSSDNSAYKTHANMMNKVTRAIYLEQFFDIAVKQALQYAAATGRGWGFPLYRRNMAGTGQGNIEIDTYGAPCVLPTQLPGNGNWQQAYAVHLMREIPVYWAHAMFPAYQDKLTPTTSRYWYQNDGVREASQGNILQRMFRQLTSKPSKSMTELLVPFRYSWIVDLTINTTKYEIPMGEPNASWAYKVPHIGQMIPYGSDEDGKTLYRPANEVDARLYPSRRLMISTDTCIPYDGPAFDWHGMLPGFSFCPDSWPWEPLGFSLVHGNYDINEAMREIMRGNMDKTRAKLNLSIAYDNTAISKNEAEMLDPMQPHGRFGYDGSALAEGKPPFQPAVPAEFLDIDPHSLEMYDRLKTELDESFAMGELMNLAKLRAVASVDELQKTMEVSGPIIDEMSRGMEPPMRDLGDMVKFLVLQYFTVSRAIQYVGPDNIASEVIDYNPSMIVPSHMAGEGTLNPDQTAKSSAYSAMQRARIFAGNLRFFITPNSLHEIAQMAAKLALLQLKKGGVKVDSQTIAEAFNVPNYGEIQGATVLDKCKTEQQMDVVGAMQAQMIAAAIQAAAEQAVQGTLPQTPPTLPPAPGAPPGAPDASSGAGAEGRPPSYEQAPQIVQKDGGTRSTISTSGK